MTLDPHHLACLEAALDLALDGPRDPDGNLTDLGKAQVRAALGLAAAPRRFCQEGENKGKPGPCPEGKGDATPAPGASPAGPPPKKTFERQEEIADKHLGNMRALLSRLESGTYTPADVLDDLDSYATPSLAANARNWSARLGLLKQRLAESYGAAALDSPEWGAVRAAVRGARDAAAEHLSGMADTVRAVALYHAANPDAPVKVRGTDDWHALGEAHDALVRAGYDATHAIADALDAFKAAHRPATGHAEVFWERPPPVPRRFCTEGENKGKPGPCPEGTDDAPHATSGAAARRHLAAGADRVTLPGGAAVHVAPHPAGGHVAFLRHPDGTGRSGHPRPSRAAAVADAQTLAVGHLKGKAVGIPLPAAQAPAAPDPAGALAATVSRLFPGARPAGPGEYQIDVPGGRELSLVAAPESGSVRIDFGNAPESGLGQQDVPAALRAGSLELARTLKAVAGSLAASGTRVSFGAVPRKQGVYARVLSSLGFTRESSRPADDAVEPGQVEEVWAPPRR